MPTATADEASRFFMKNVVKYWARFHSNYIIFFIYDKIECCPVSRIG